MLKKIIIGVMGPGPGATDSDVENAFSIGRAIAQQGWILLTGGMPIGVMEAASRGAKEGGGLTVGILPVDNPAIASKFVDIPIATGMGSARNNINILSSHVVIACGIGPGTASEIALAIKGGKEVILLNSMEESLSFFKKLSPQQVLIAESVDHVIKLIHEYMDKLSTGPSS